MHSASLEPLPTGFDHPGHCSGRSHCHHQNSCGHHRRHGAISRSLRSRRTQKAPSQLDGFMHPLAEFHREAQVFVILMVLPWWSKLFVSFMCFQDEPLHDSKLETMMVLRGRFFVARCQPGRCREDGHRDGLRRSSGREFLSRRDVQCFLLYGQQTQVYSIQMYTSIVVSVWVSCQRW